MDDYYIDIISKEKIHIYDIFNIEKPKINIVRSIKNNELKWELFINPNAEFIECNYNGNILKLSPIEEILKWKNKFIIKFHQGLKNQKHKKDLTIY